MVVVISGPAMRSVDDVEPGAPVSIDAGFDAFVRDQGPRLGRAAFLLTGDHQLAEDLVQTALAKVSVRWERVVARGDPAPMAAIGSAGRCWSCLRASGPLSCCGSTRT